MTSSKIRKRRLVLCNDGGTLVGPTKEAPIGEDGLVELTINPLIGTQIDTLYWQLGTDVAQGYPSHRLSDIYSHRTEVGPLLGQDHPVFETAGLWRAHRNTQHLFERKTDPPEVVIKHGHNARLDVFLSLRMNDTHDGSLDSIDHPMLSDMKKKHPEWLLQPVKDGGRNAFGRFSYDYSVAEVRVYKLALIREAIENYDLDGLDLDFCRYPRLFETGEGEKNAHLITQLVRDVRKMLDRKSKAVGRKLEFSVRVPPTFAIAFAFGIDIGTWLEENLIDILIVGAVKEASAHRLPVEEYVNAARDKGIAVLAQCLGGPKKYNPTFSAGPLWHESPGFSNEMYRASAATYWQAGVDGLYLWNSHLYEFQCDVHYDHRSWYELADPVLLSSLDKQYVVDDRRATRGAGTQLGIKTVPDAQIPVDLARPGDIADIVFDIADEPDGGAGKIRPKNATLRLMISQHTSLDELNIELNDRRLDWSSGCRKIHYNESWVDFAVESVLKNGWNRLRIKLNLRNQYVNCPLTLERVEVIVRYQ